MKQFIMVQDMNGTSYIINTSKIVYTVHEEDKYKVQTFTVFVDEGSILRPIVIGVDSYSRLFNHLIND